VYVHKKKYEEKRLKERTEKRMRDRIVY